MKTVFQNQSQQSSELDERPRFGIGHITLDVTDVARSVAFYQAIGMRLVVDMGDAAILELRGGTHLIVRRSQSVDGSLDLITDEIDETHQLMAANGANPGKIKRGSPHDRFVAADPDGNTLVVASNHAVGPV